MNHYYHINMEKIDILFKYNKYIYIIMELLCQTLTFYHIPFNLKQKKENIIIIPNGVIKVKNFHTIRNVNDMNDYIKQLNHLSAQYNLPVYGFNININTNNFINFYEYCQYINQHINTNINICSSLDEIIVGEYCYAIRTTGAIWTLVTLFSDFYPIIQDKIIIITSDTYKRAIVIMTDEELELFHKYNINIIDSNSINTSINNISIIYITQDTFRERELFTFKIDYIPLNGGNRSPCRVVDGITTICPNCGNIVYYDKDGNIRKHQPCFL